MQQPLIRCLIPSAPHLVLSFQSYPPRSLKVQLDVKSVRRCPTLRSLRACLLVYPPARARAVLAITAAATVVSALGERQKLGRRQHRLRPLRQLPLPPSLSSLVENTLLSSSPLLCCNNNQQTEGKVLPVGGARTVPPFPPLACTTPTARRRRAPACLPASTELCLCLILMPT